MKSRGFSKFRMVEVFERNAKHVRGRLSVDLTDWTGYFVPIILDELSLIFEKYFSEV